ncbi:MAG: triphosphoribosyl-dephospho-CoA synthase [Methylophagaceae bacterium]
MLNTNQLQQCIIWACEQEVSAPKPGNVNCFSDGHNMAVQNFIDSAHAIAPILAQTNSNVGEMILQAITATRTVVNCNTNLGIVLLFAPLCIAIQNCQKFEQLSHQLKKVLENLTIDDAKKCYQAIRLAEAGGLSEYEQQDINSSPTVTLREAMALAQDRDTIAAQYLNNYHEIFHIGRPNFITAINSGENVEWASAFAYLKLLSNIPDSLICRKQGLECARRIMEEAKKISDKVTDNNHLSGFEAVIIQWDNKLKLKAINPGTTADLTAATLLIYAFEGAF